MDEGEVDEACSDSDSTRKAAGAKRRRSLSSHVPTRAEAFLLTTISYSLFLSSDALLLLIVPLPALHITLPSQRQHMESAAYSRRSVEWGMSTRTEGTMRIALPMRDFRHPTLYTTRPAQGYTPEQLVFLDESSFQPTTAHRAQGWDAVGHVAHIFKPAPSSLDGRSGIPRTAWWTSNLIRTGKPWGGGRADWPQCQKAMEDEHNNLLERGVIEPAELPAGRKAIGCRWTHKVKTDAEGAFTKRKARLVAQGFSQVEGVNQ